MFDTLDIVISFIFMVFILSLVAQSVQSILKRLLKLKTKQALNVVAEVFDAVPGIVSSESLRKDLQGIKKKVSTPDLNLSAMEGLVGEVFKLGAVKNQLVGTPVTADSVKTAVLDKLAQDIDTFKERYVHSMRQLAVFIALLICALLNADSFQILEKISSDKAVRQMIVQSDYIQKKLIANKKASNPKMESSAKASADINAELEGISELTKEYQGLNLGVKWSLTVSEFKRLENRADQAFYILKKLAGVLITTALVSMGAPFWHDILETLFGMKNKLKDNT